eukprot:m.204792 g.204792  ORF g.204792 m.204792 type:complete len:1634 (+) comp17750_c0_seq1:81-4982(+)
MSDDKAVCAGAMYRCRDAPNPAVSIPDDVQPSARRVQIVVAANAGEMDVERQVLFDNALPQLRTFFAENGFSFSMVDLNMFPVEASSGKTLPRDHEELELWLSQVRDSHAVSAGVFLIALTGQKYGHNLIPKSIPPADMTAMMNTIREVEVRRAVEEWYSVDADKGFVLLPPSVKYDSFAKGSPSPKHLQAYADATTRVRQILFDAATTAFASEPDRMQKYTASLLDNVVTEALRLAPTRCVVLQRSVKGLETRPGEGKVRGFLDYSADGSINKALSGRMATACKGCSDALQFEIPFSGLGIDPENGEHRQYLNKFCEQVVAKCKTAFTQVSKAQAANNLVRHESLAHAWKCKQYLDVPLGTSTTAGVLHAYVSGSEQVPLLLVGPAGCGKSTAMAVTASAARVNTEAIILMRFLDGTALSPFHLVAGLARQLAAALSVPLTPPVRNLHSAVNAFHTLLKTATNRQIVVLLDGVDKLATSAQPNLLAFVPASLPSNVKIIVSATVGEKTSVLHPESALYKHCKVAKMEHSTVALANEVRQAYVAAYRLHLTQIQEQALAPIAKDCKTLIGVRAALEVAKHWHTNTPKEDCALASGGDEKLLAKLLHDISARHGAELTSRTLASIALAKHGLTEAELEDLLSADDEVLETLHITQPPTMRRVSQHAVRALLLDLLDHAVFLRVSYADGQRVLCIAHDHVRELVVRLHAAAGKDHRKVCVGLSDLFHGKWAGERKPVAGKPKTAMDRGVAPQPVMFETQANRRKLSELPHACSIGQFVEDHAHNVLYNFAFLSAALSCSSVDDLIDLYDSGHENMQDTLILSRHVLEADSEQLASQLMGRLAQSLSSGVVKDKDPSAKMKRAAIELMLDQVRTFASTAETYRFVPSHSCLQPPERCKLMARCACDVTCLLAADAHKRLLLATSDGVIQVLDESGKLHHVLARHNNPVVDMVLLHKDKVVSLDAECCGKVWDLSSATGEASASFSVQGRSPLALGVSADGNHISVAASDGSLTTFDASGNLIGSTAYEVTKPVLAARFCGGNVVFASAGSVHLVSVEDAVVETIVAENPIVATDGTSRVFLASPQGIQARHFRDNGATVSLPHSAQANGRILRRIQASADGKTVVALFNDAANVYEVGDDAFKLLGSVDLFVSSAKFSPVAVLNSGACILAPTETEVFEYPSSGLSEQALSAVDLTADPGIFAIMSREAASAQVHLWDLGSGRSFKSVQVLPGSSFKSTDDGTVLLINNGGQLTSLRGEDLQPLVKEYMPIEGEAASLPIERMSIGKGANGWCAAVQRGPRTLAVYDVPSGSLLKVFEDAAAEGQAVTDLCVGLGESFVCSSSDGSVRLLDVASGAVTVSSAQHSAKITSIALCDLGLVLSGSDDRTVRAWDLNKGLALAKTLSGHSTPVIKVVSALTAAIAASLAAIEDHFEVMVWSMDSANSATTRLTVPPSPFPVNDILLSASGFLITNEVHTLKVWNCYTGSLLGSFCSDAAIHSMLCNFSAPGKTTTRERLVVSDSGKRVSEFVLPKAVKEKAKLSGKSLLGQLGVQDASALLAGRSALKAATLRPAPAVEKKPETAQPDFVLPSELKRRSMMDSAAASRTNSSNQVVPEPVLEEAAVDAVAVRKACCAVM